MAKIDAAYSYYLHTYGNSTVSRYDTHKKSELRNTYNRMVKINKDSPLYKISSSGDAKKFAIDIKENARRIQNVVSSLSEGEDGLASNFQKKIAVSSNEEIATATYVGDNSEAENTDSFSLVVQKLATPQVNYGNFLENDTLDIAPGSYSFDLNTALNSYEFQFNVNDDDNNRSILNKLSRLINGAGIGLRAKLVTNDRDTSALRIESVQTGLEEQDTALFSIYPAADGNSIQALETLGIGNVAANAENSVFLLNGKEHSSYSNTFTVNNMFSVTLNGGSQPGHAAAVGFKPSADAVADNIERLVAAYNGIVNTANQYADAQESSGNLLQDVRKIVNRFSDDLSEIGLKVEEDSSLSIDREALTESISNGDISHTFDVLNKFRDALGRKADQASINPMNYVSKVIVAYKHPNPDKNFATPYITSMYSGMMVDRFC